MKWEIVVHPKALDELNQLPLEMQAKLTRLLEIMKITGPFSLHEPHVKNLGNKLWEIRLTGRDGISRVIYVILTHQKVKILHAFIKKTQKTPHKNMDCALKRLKED